MEDNGIGFVPAEVLVTRRGLGLVSMEERVRVAGGKFHLRSQPGRGAEILVDVPLRRVSS